MRARLLVAFIAAIAAFGCSSSQAPAVDPAVAAVAASVQGFLQQLPPPLRAKASRPFDDKERTAWAFVPGRYPGVEFGDLDADAMERARGVIRSLLSTRGYEKTMAIVQLENVLRELEGKGGRDVGHRDPARYTLLVCGEVAPASTFSVRFQGHHISLHFTFLDGWLVGATPQFLGSNPHELREGPNTGQRVLVVEEDLGRQLLGSLDSKQRAIAVIDPKAPPDILLGPAAAFGVLGAPKGLAAAAMNAEQRELLWRLVEEFTNNLRLEFAVQELQRLRPQLADLHFAWAGGSERGQGHYWRVQGKTFAIEYDNTQNDANHVHVVWRDLERDFGQDPLRAHLLEHPHGSGR